MIKYYRYRWICAFFLGAVIFFTGYISLLQSQWASLILLKQKENELNKDLKVLQEQKLQKRAAIKEVKKNKEIALENRPVNLASDISILAEKMRFSGLAVLALEVLEDREKSRLVAFVHAQVEARSDLLMSFLYSISSSLSPLFIMLLDFNLRPGKENMFILDMDLLLTREPLFKSLFAGLMPLRKNSTNTFCSVKGEMTVVHRGSQEEAASVSLYRMKMTGYVSQGSEHEAFLRLPSEHLITVKIGSLLGKEQGVVSAIYAHHLEVELPDGKKYVYQLY